MSQVCTLATHTGKAAVKGKDMDLDPPTLIPLRMQNRHAFNSTVYRFAHGLFLSEFNCEHKSLGVFRSQRSRAASDADRAQAQRVGCSPEPQRTNKTDRINVVFKYTKLMFPFKLDMYGTGHRLVVCEYVCSHNPTVKVTNCVTQFKIWKQNYLKFKTSKFLIRDL